MPKKRCQLMLTYQARDPSHLTRTSNFKKLKAQFSTNQKLKDEIEKKNQSYKRIKKNCNYKISQIKT